MFKITLYDENCSQTCDGTTSFFADVLEEFECNWCHRANKEQLVRYKRSKAGEIVTDYYSNDPELNIVQEDKKSEILFEKEIVLKDKLFTLLNTYRCEKEVYAAETTLLFRGIRFNSECYLIGQYKMRGICQKPFIYDKEDVFETVKAWGNPIIICNLQHKEKWHETDLGREFLSYHKENFAEDTLETYCWVTLGEYSEDELLAGNIDFESEEMMVRLMRDIPGEAG